MRLYPSCEPSVVWRFVAEHPEAVDFDVSWFAPPGMCEDAAGVILPLAHLCHQPGQVGVATPHASQRHLAAEPLARLEALVHFRSTINAQMNSCIDVSRRLGPTAGRAALAQQLTRFEHNAMRRTWRRVWRWEHRHDWRGDHYTVAMGNALWREAWNTNLDVVAADFLHCGNFARNVCSAAALREVEQRLVELGDFPHLPLEAQVLDQTLQCIETLCFDGYCIGDVADVTPSSMGLDATVVVVGEDEVHACCATHYASQTYAKLQPWRLTHAQWMQLPWSESGALLRDPPRTSLGLTPRTEEPDEPPNICPQYCTIEYSGAAACASGTGSHTVSVARVDNACRLFVLNLAWSTTESELWAHLAGALSSGAVRSVIILRWSDGRSRGIAKVVMSAAGHVVTVIEALNGEELGGRPLTLCHDRLQPFESAAEQRTSCRDVAFQDDGPD